MSDLIAADSYSYRLAWSPRDGKYVGLVSEFPSLYWLADNPVEALDGAVRLVGQILTMMSGKGIEPPAPLNVERDDMGGADRGELQLAIAARLAAERGLTWHTAAAEVRTALLGDADALIIQGLTPHWDEPAIAEPSVELEVEAFEFDRALDWLIGYLEERHPEMWRDGQMPTVRFEDADSADWDGWVSVAAQASPAGRQLWARKHGQSQTARLLADVTSNTVPARPRSGSAGRGDERGRFAAAIGAVLAHRRGQQWVGLARSGRAGYLSEANALIDAGLTSYIRR